MPENDMNSVRSISPATENLDESDVDDNVSNSMKARLQGFSYQPIEVEMPKSTRIRRRSSDAAPEPSKRRRAAATATVAESASAPKNRSTKQERAAGDPYKPENNLVDSLRPGLILVLIGLNPGLTTAKTGHAYAHSSNLFWKLLHWSGITPIKHLPEDTHSLPDLYLIGNTNICERATRTGAGLSKEELAEGALILDAKINKFKPEAVCIVGKSIWETIYKAKTGKNPTKTEFKYGWQDEKLWLGREADESNAVVWAGSRTFVATTTSGLAAGMSTQQKLDIWKPLGEWVQERNGQPVGDEADKDLHIKSEGDVKVEDDDDDDPV